MSRRLDEIDKRILYYLVEDARGTSAPTIAEDVDVSPGTIRNRIEQLEEAGIITGYHADVEYERCEGRLTNLFVCNVSGAERAALAEQALRIPGVVHVRELRTGRGNLQIKAVAEDTGDLSRIGEQLTKLGVEIEDEDLVQNEYTAPYHPFGPGEGTDRVATTDFVSLSGEAEVVDVTVGEASPLTGRTLSEANDEGLLEDEVLVIAIEREDEVLTPKGYTGIRAGDLVTVFSRGGVSDQLVDVFRG